VLGDPQGVVDTLTEIDELLGAVDGVGGLGRHRSQEELEPLLYLAALSYCLQAVVKADRCNSKNPLRYRSGLGSRSRSVRGALDD